MSLAKPFELPVHFKGADPALGDGYPVHHVLSQHNDVHVRASPRGRFNRAS